MVLLAGIYLAAAGPFDFGSTFVSIGIVIIVVLLGLGGAFFAPRERKAAELAERDVAASAGGEVKLSAEYEALAGRLRIAGIASSLLVVVAVFVMVTSCSDMAVSRPDRRHGTASPRPGPPASLRPGREAEGVTPGARNHET